MRKLGRWTVLALMLGSAGSTTTCGVMAQSHQVPLRGPISGAVSTTEKSPAAANSGQHRARVSTSPSGAGSGTKTAPAESDSLLTPGESSNSESDENVGTMSPPPIPPVQFKTTTEPHTNISIPLDLDENNNLLLHPENKKPEEPLSAVLSNIEMSTGPQEVILGPYHGLPVHVKNTTDRPLLFNGDAAMIRVGNHSIRPVTVRQIDQLVDPMETLRDDVKATIRAGVSVGLRPTIVQEEIQRGPILNRYGPDEQRRESEESRFGKRIIWPGDSTDGIVYFQTGSSLRGGMLELPVCSMTKPERANLSGGTTVNGITEIKPVAAGAVSIPSQQEAKPTSAPGTAVPPLPEAKHKRKSRKREHPQAAGD